MLAEGEKASEGIVAGQRERETVKKASVLWKEARRGPGAQPKVLAAKGLEKPSPGGDAYPCL